MARVGIRADASHNMGLGHILRTMAIAQYLLQHGHHVTYFAWSVPAGLEYRLYQAGCALQMLPDQRAESMIHALHAHAIQALVVDQYDLDPRWRQSVRSQVRAVLTIDDLARQPAYHTDILVNPSADLPEQVYQQACPDARILLGANYTLLRRDITTWIGKVPWPREPILTLVFGGTDILDLAVQLTPLLAAQLAGKARIHVITARDIALEGGGSSSVTVHKHVTDMGAVLAPSRLLVTAGGTTLSEAAALRLPAFVTMVAGNQRLSVAQAEARGWVQAVDARRTSPADMARRISALWHTTPELDRMYACTAGLVDGKGAERAAEALLAVL